MADSNILYYGDNLDILRRYIKDESVDLVYLDPPFNSNQDYNVLFAEKDGTRSAAQIKAFGDTWRWDQGSAKVYRESVEGGGQASKVMQAFRTFLGENDMLAYLSMMAPRLVELRRVLKPTGSIYLHCDPTASHYLKLLMDAVFGADSFQNEIIWCYRSGGATRRRFARKHDVLLFYSKGEQYRFTPQHVPYVMAGILRDEKGPYQIQYGKRVDFNPEGALMPDWWEISLISSVSRERLGYPTQKPEALLERIIQASSNEGDVVLDPFCGCGTTIAVAERLKRYWIGIDVTHLAITLIKHRLYDAYGGRAIYKVIGEPVSLPDAEALASEDKYQFQWWATGLVGARPTDPKKGSDKGVDGRLFFHDEADETKTKQVVLSVKGGEHLGPAFVRDLKGVMQRDKAQIGVLITLREPTREMKAEAASAGFYASPGWGKDYPAIQLLTVGDLLAGKGIEMPPQRQVNTTFRRAPRTRRESGHTAAMPLDQSN